MTKFPTENLLYCIVYWEYDCGILLSSDRVLQHWIFCSQLFQRKASNLSLINRNRNVSKRPVELLHGWPICPSCRQVGWADITIHLGGVVCHIKLRNSRESVQVNLCQKLFFWQNMGRTFCVQKLSWMLETISVHNMFSPGLSLEFSCIELVIQWTICRHIVG